MMSSLNKNISKAKSKTAGMIGIENMILQPIDTPWYWSQTLSDFSLFANVKLWYSKPKHACTENANCYKEVD